MWTAAGGWPGSQDIVQQSGPVVRGGLRQGCILNAVKGLGLGFPVMSATICPLP
jgi:hypothetical protein